MKNTNAQLYSPLKQVFLYLFKPTQATPDLMGQEKNTKIIIVGILLAVYSFVIVLSIYLGIMGGMLDSIFYVKKFTYTIIFSLIFVGIVFYIGKVFGGKGKYIDLLMITALANIPSIFLGFLFITLNIAGIVLSIGSLWSIIIFIWFLVIWSKGLSKVEEFSETKVTITVVISLIIYYLLNSFLTGVLGMSAF